MIKNKKKMILGILLAILSCGVIVKSSEVITKTAIAEEIGTNNYADVASISLGNKAKSAYLMDFSSQKPIYTKQENERLPIASMCKIMTLLLTFEALDNGVITLEEEIMVSDRAASMGGSQVFLEANGKYYVNELIKSIVVCSANDSCVALAEKIAGSENLFVEKMNARAQELAMQDTLFANCTGLPMQPQYSCAKDVAIMFKELLTHEKYYDFGNIWMDKFQHPGGRYTEISNTNKLIRFYDGCDGGKTGFTNEAGFCLAATARRGDMRLISVVIGEESSKDRFDDVRTMFDYAFANYTNKMLIKAGEALDIKVSLPGGKQKYVPVALERPLCDFIKRGEKSGVTWDIHIHKISAPVQKGDCVGELYVYRNGVEVDRIPILAMEDIQEASFIDKLKDISRQWNG